MKTANVFAFYKPGFRLVLLKVAQGAEGVSLIRGSGMPLQLTEPVEHPFCQEQSLKPAGFSRIQSSFSRVPGVW